MQRQASTVKIRVVHAIRNFCIIAHIDHGKSTLADRLMEVAGAVESRDQRDQLLDTMDLERERGITIKLQPVRMHWRNTQLNLIDTPGHADFAYEVSRTLAAVEGALLVVDASQGIEAQTLANVYAALERDLTLIPVINKIDLPAAEPDRVAAEIQRTLSLPADSALRVSAKDGTGVPAVLDAICQRIPEATAANAPQTSAELSAGPATALIFDSIFDSYRGVVLYVRVMSGILRKGHAVQLLRAGSGFDVLEVGSFTPAYRPETALVAGEIGYVITGLKTVRDARVGDTVWKPGEQISRSTPPAPLPGYQHVRPFVFASVFAVNTDDYPRLREALEKLAVNDASIAYEPEQSSALGLGFRCGFLGLLHLEIIHARLEREYGLDLIATAPSVRYEAILKDGTNLPVPAASALPDASCIAELREPWARVEIVTPKTYLGALLELVTRRRGQAAGMNFLDETRVQVSYDLPLASIVTDFYDALKSLSAGYASLSYEHREFRAGDLVRLDILVAGEIVDALATIVHRDQSRQIGGAVVARLKDVIPRQQFPVAVQAAIGGTIIARQTISAYRKDVTAKLYGGDVTRKNKLLKKQKDGKKRAKQFGSVTLPQEAFMAVLRREQ